MRLNHEFRIPGALPVLAATLLLSGAALGAPAADPPGSRYAVEGRIELGGTGHWDYAAFDGARQRLFVTRGDHVEVVDVTTAKKVGEIADTQGVHGVAFAPERKLGYTSNGKADNLTVFDLDTLVVKGTIAVAGHNPDALLYDAASGHLLSMNGRSRDIDVIDASSGRVLHTIAVGGKPEFAAVEGARLYVNIEDTNSLGVVDLDAGRLIATWKLPDCEEPTGLAFDAASRRVFSVCANGRLVVTDAATGRNVASVAVGKGPDAAAWDATRKVVFSSAGQDGTLTVVAQQDADHYIVVDTVPTAKRARTMALDPQSGRVWLPTPVDGSFAVIVVAPSK